MTPDLLEQCVARLMADELESRRLSVTLVRCWGWYGDEGRKRRVVEERNPSWYRRLCAMYQSGRTRPRRSQKPDTLIKRRCVLRALDEIEGGAVETEYAQRVYEFVQQRARKMLREREASL